MKALILAGGFATRLRPLSCSRPKTLFPILNKPLIQWTFERLAKNDINEAILAANSLTETQIKQHPIRKAGVKIRYSPDPPRKPLGTAGPIRKSHGLLAEEKTFLALNGDIFADVNYTELLKNHRAKNCVATIALRAVDNPSRYGVAELAEDGRIVRFVEKPVGKSPSKLINAGVYALNRKIFDYIPEGRAVSIEREVFPQLVKENQLYGYVYDGLWADIGKPRDFLNLNDTLLDMTSQDPPKTRADASLAKPVALDGKMIIGEKAVVGPYAVLGKNVIIGKNVRIKHSVILPDTSIDDSSEITGAIVGQTVRIGKNTVIPSGCIIGDHATIRDNVKLRENVSICPAVDVHENVTEANRIC